MEVGPRNGTNKTGEDGLFMALRTGVLDTFKKQLAIIKRDPNEFQNWNNKYISNGKTMLHKACKFGHLNIVEYLIQNGADINAKDNLGITPILSALWEGNLHIAKYLIDKGANTINLTPHGLKNYKSNEVEEMINFLKDVDPRIVGLPPY